MENVRALISRTKGKYKPCSSFYTGRVNGWHPKYPARSLCVLDRRSGQTIPLLYCEQKEWTNPPQFHLPKYLH